MHSFFDEQNSSKNQNIRDVHFSLTAFAFVFSSTVADTSLVWTLHSGIVPISQPSPVAFVGWSLIHAQHFARNTKITVIKDYQMSSFNLQRTLAYCSPNLVV